jgi:cytochrome c oxidase cbb3-type subunit 4
MDVNTLRITVTVVSLLLFLGIALWTWQRSRKAEFEEAARLPFADEEDDAAALVGRSRKGNPR